MRKLARSAVTHAVNFSVKPEVFISFNNELVSRSRRRLQHLRSGGVDFDFLAQAMDELLEQLAIARAFVSPHLH